MQTHFSKFWWQCQIRILNVDADTDADTVQSYTKFWWQCQIRTLNVDADTDADTVQSYTVKQNAYQYIK